jgi:hypothetical protein
MNCNGSAGEPNNERDAGATSAGKTNQIKQLRAGDARLPVRRTIELRI